MVFHDKFNGVTEHKVVNEALYQDSMKILKHRNGTELEDISVFDARMGQLIVKNDSSVR